MQLPLLLCGLSPKLFANVLSICTDVCQNVIGEDDAKSSAVPSFLSLSIPLFPRPPFAWQFPSTGRLAIDTLISNILVLHILPQKVYVDVDYY